MRCKVWLMFLLSALAMVAESTTFHETSRGLAHFGHDDTKFMHWRTLYVDDLTKTLMDSQTNRRQLAQRKKYISYDALKNSYVVPCKRHGQSYYGCQYRRRVNPYTRGCSVITRCYRLRFPD